MAVSGHCMALAERLDGRVACVYPPYKGIYMRRSDALKAMAPSEPINNY